MASEPDAECSDDGDRDGKECSHDLLLNRSSREFGELIVLLRVGLAADADRIKAQSTFEALQIGAALDPNAAAIRFLTKADPEETPVTVSHAQFMARVTQSANFFHDLGVGPNDVVSFLMPLLPQTFFALFGAQAAGIANPVNPLLSAVQIAEILRAANTKVLVALGPVLGSDIWDKVQQVKGQLPNLKAIVVVHGVANDANAVYDFDAMVGQFPADRLSSGRRILASDTAGYFHTGGTTGTPKLVRHTHANQVYQAWVMGLMLPFGPARNLLFGLPLFHVGGALTQGLAPLAGGNTLVVLGGRASSHRASSARGRGRPFRA